MRIKILKRAMCLIMIITSAISFAQSPSWTWARASGNGNLLSEGQAVATDAAGNVFITGYFNAPTITFGNFTLTRGGNSGSGVYGIYVVKYSSNGTVLWARSAGGSSLDIPYGISADAAGNVWVTGSFNSSPFIDFGNGYTIAYLNGENYFIVKYNGATGNTMLANGVSSGTTTGTSHRNVGYSVTTDGTGVYVTGAFTNPTMFLSGTPILNSSPTHLFTSFVVKYDYNGSTVWSKSALLTGTGNCRPYDIATNSGGVYITGDFLGSGLVNFGTTGSPIAPLNAGISDIFIAKYNVTSGAIQWAKSYGGTTNDYGNSISSDACGNIYTTGYFASSSITFGTNTFTNVGNKDMFVTKCDDATGNVQWAKQVGGSLDEIGYSISADLVGNIYVTGRFDLLPGYNVSYVPVNFGSSISLTPPSGSVDPMFVVKYDLNGNTLTGTALSSGSDDRNDVAVDAVGNAYITGDYMATTPSFLGLGSPLDENIFIAKYNSSCCTAPTLGLTASSNLICQGQSVILTATGGGAYTWTSVPAGTYPSSAQITVTPSVTTVYTVTATGVCPNMASTTITVSPTPPTAIIGNTFACNTTTSETYTLQGTTAGVIYTWTITGGTPTTATGTSCNVLWNSSNGGTISVNTAGAACPATLLTVNSCCQVPSTGTTVYLSGASPNHGATYTSYSNNSITTGAPFIYVINGTYTINSAVVFSGCQTYFGPYAQVNINSGASLTLNSNAGIPTVWQAGCGTMWNGIVINSGGSLLVDNSTIQDAILAIDSRQGALVSVQNNSKLNLNFRNVVLETYTLGTHPFTIKASKVGSFNSSNQPVSTLLPPYAAGTQRPISQGGGTYSGRTYSGIEIQNCTQVNIGDASASTLLNTFNNMDRAIDNLNSGLTVYNNSFTNVTYASGTPQRGYCIYSSNTSGTVKTLIVGGNATNYQKNTFSNSNWGVKADQNQITNVSYNTFTNMNTGVYLSNMTTTTCSSAVDNNIIDDCDYGIFGYNNTGYSIFTARLNKINNTGTAKPNAKGISISNPTLSTNALPTLSILNNSIKRVSRGIEVTNFTHPDIEHNLVLNVSDLGYGVDANGMLITTCPSAEVRYNRVSGAYAAAWWQTGIRFESCISALVTRDTVTDIGRGLWFGATCNNSEVAMNRMVNNYDGLYLNWGIISPQYAPAGACIATGNTWSGMLNSNIYAGNSYGTDSPFYELCSTCGGYTSDMHTANTMSLNGPIGASSAVPILPCNTLSTRSMNHGNNDEWHKITENKHYFNTYDASGKWWEKYNLYNVLKNDTSLAGQDSVLKTFADSIAGVGIGKLYQTNQAINSTLSGTATASATNATVIAGNQQEQYLKDVNDIIISSRANNNVLSASDISTLKSIAKLCPYESGPAVYNARVLLSSVDTRVYKNDCEDAKPIKHKHLILTEGNAPIAVFPNPANDKLNIAIHLEEGQTGKLNVYDLTGKLVLTSDIHSNTDVTEISTVSLNEGIYIYKLNINNATLNTGKLSIIR